MTAKKHSDVSDRQALVRVSERLYRSQHSARYYALLKRGGKQIKRPLKISDRELAKRRLVEFREKAERLTGKASAILFAELAKRWVDVVGATLKGQFEVPTRDCDQGVAAELPHRHPCHQQIAGGKKTSAFPGSASPPRKARAARTG